MVIPLGNIGSIVDHMEGLIVKKFGSEDVPQGTGFQTWTIKGTIRETLTALLACTIAKGYLLHGRNEYTWRNVQGGTLDVGGNEASHFRLYAVLKQVSDTNQTLLEITGYPTDHRAKYGVSGDNR